MARFSANITDSSEDEEDVYLDPPRPTKEKQPERTRRSPPRRITAPVDEDSEEESEEDASSSSSRSSNMHEDELLNPPRKARGAPPRNALVEDEDGEFRFAHEANDHDRRPQSKKSPPRRRGDPTIIPWAQQLGVDAQKMHVMQTSLFRMPEEAASMKAATKPTTAASKPKMLLPPSMNKKHSRDSEGDGMRVDHREVRLFVNISRYMYETSFVASFFCS